MTEDTSINGRPRWTDVLHQLELTEGRIKDSIRGESTSLRADIADVKIDVAHSQKAIVDLGSKVQHLETNQMLYEQRKSDLFTVGAIGRSLLLLVVAVGGLFLGVLNLVRSS